ncbi:hypothetical protein C8R43DRAFT_959746 [Mycena crocata]|nr:hypothetical protein C8R43DRAFT_959746 [Mycena crocata]
MYTQLILFALAGSISATRELPPLQARQDFRLSTGAPLTLTLSLTPTPTQTDAAVSTAYAVYTQACGSALAQALQDGLAVYNGMFSNMPATTNISDSKFQSWLGGPSGLITNVRSAKEACSRSKEDLAMAKDDANRDGSTSTITSSSAGSGGGSASSSAGKLTGPTPITGAAPSAPSTNEAATTDHLQLLVSMIAAWGLRLAILD